jgi:hypothetical protein
MNIRFVQAFSLAALGSVAALVLSSCSSVPTEQAPDRLATASSYWHGSPQGMAVQTRALSGSVAEVDAATRTLTLSTANGKRSEVQCAADVLNFDEIHAGDQVNVVAAEQLVTYMAKAGTGEGSYAAASVVLAPRGRKEGGIVANTMRTNARLMGIDIKGYKVTLQFADGATRAVVVRPEVDLGQRYVGEQVAVWITPLLGLSVEKQ